MVNVVISQCTIQTSRKRKVRRTIAISRFVVINVIKNKKNMCTNVAIDSVDQPGVV